MAYSVQITMSPTSAAPTYTGSPWVSGVLVGGENIDRNRLASVGTLREEVDISRGGNLSQVSSTEIGFALEAGEWEAMVAANATAVGGRVVCYLDGYARWWGEVVDEEFAGGVLRLSCESPTMRLQNQQAPAVAYDIEGYPQMRQDDTGLAGPMVYGYCTESRVIGDRWDDQTPYGNAALDSLLSPCTPDMNTPLGAKGFTNGVSGDSLDWRSGRTTIVYAKGSPGSNEIALSTGLYNVAPVPSQYAPQDIAPSIDGALDEDGVPWDALSTAGILVAKSGQIGASTAFAPIYLEDPPGAPLIELLDAPDVITIWGNHQLPYGKSIVRWVTVNAGFFEAIEVGDHVAVSAVDLTAIVADRSVVVSSSPYQIQERRKRYLPGWDLESTPVTSIQRAAGYTAEATALRRVISGAVLVGRDYALQMSGGDSVRPVFEATKPTFTEAGGALIATISVASSGVALAPNGRVVSYLAHLYRFSDPIEKADGDRFAGDSNWSASGTWIPAGESNPGVSYIWVCGHRTYSNDADIPVGALLTGVIALYGTTVNASGSYGATWEQTFFVLSTTFETWNEQAAASDAIGDDSGPVLVDLTGPVIVDAIAGDTTMPVGAVIRTAPDIVRDILRTRTDGFILPDDASILSARYALEIASGDGLEAIRCAISTTEQAPVSDWLVSLASDWGMVLSPSTIPGVMDIRTPWASWGDAVEHTIQSGDVVQDSTQGLGMTDLRDLINQPVFKFHFSEASKYRRSARIQRIDADPSAVTPTTVQGYASGFPNSAIAQTAWGVCHDSRAKYGLTRQDEIELRTVPEGTLWGAIGAASPALSRIEWLASRKRTIALEVHESHSAAFAALGSLISVRHKRYLTSASRGIVVAREWDPEARTSRLSIMLAPSQLDSPIGATTLVDTLDPDADTLVDTINAAADTVVDTLET